MFTLGFLVKNMVLKIKKVFRLLKENLSWPVEPKFYIPEDVLDFYRQAIKHGADQEAQWKQLFEPYQKAYPDLAAGLFRRLDRKLPQDWDKDLPVFPADPKGLATRASSGKILNALAKDFTVRRFQQGETIFFQGDPGQALYLIEAGRVRIYVQATAARKRR
jgi:transketolase